LRKQRDRFSVRNFALPTLQPTDGLGRQPCLFGEGLLREPRSKAQGLSTRDCEPSLRALLGQATPLSPSTISRVNKQFHDEYKTWCKRPIANEFVYL